MEAPEKVDVRIGDHSPDYYEGFDKGYRSGVYRGFQDLLSLFGIVFVVCLIYRNLVN